MTENQSIQFIKPVELFTIDFKPSVKAISIVQTFNRNLKQSPGSIEIPIEIAEDFIAKFQAAADSFKKRNKPVPLEQGKNLFSAMRLAINRGGANE